MVWFGLFIHPFSHICNTGHVKLLITIYNITKSIWTSTQYNVINNNAKFKNQLEVELPIYLYMCIYMNIYMSKSAS